MQQSYERKILGVNNKYGQMKIVRPNDYIFRFDTYTKFLGTLYNSRELHMSWTSCYFDTIDCEPKKIVISTLETDEDLLLADMVYNCYKDNIYYTVTNDTITIFSPYDRFVCDVRSRMDLNGYLNIHVNAVDVVNKNKFILNTGDSIFNNFDNKYIDKICEKFHYQKFH